ncbi:MAG: hypothetical protein F6K16_35365 [Symploca sp. SIO2B6]|nr:hypothetical protein [Symploca sp. SIO2B6]
MRKILGLIVGAIALSVTPDAIAQETRIEIFDYGYMVVPDYAIDQYMSGVGAAITNAAGERDASTAATPQFYAETCADFDNWQEANFHYLLGTAHPRVDHDGNGIACEYLTTTTRIDGTVVNTISTTSGQVEIRKVEDSYYLWIEEATYRGVDLPQISTRLFPDFQSARRHYERYYRGR